MASQSRKLGTFVGCLTPIFLLAGPILIAAGIGANFLGITGSVLLGLGLLGLSVRKR
ncbi:MAG TPA: hypothetical protein PLP05_11090 [Sedimentisphaerales bacterium]|nr:hypothetical protein [Sedimentisphaerales bacterium]